MSIRPVEMQGVVQRSQDMSHIKAGEDNKPMVDHANILSAHQKELQQKQENVIKKDNADFFNEQYDAKEKGHNEYYDGKPGSRKKKKEAKDDEGTVKVKKKNASFDVKI